LLLVQAVGDVKRSRTVGISRVARERPPDVGEGDQAAKPNVIGREMDRMIDEFS
jgi:hypothetical protein